MDLILKVEINKSLGKHRLNLKTTDGKILRICQGTLKSSKLIARAIHEGTGNEGNFILIDLHSHVLGKILDWTVIECYLTNPNTAVNGMSRWYQTKQLQTIFFNVNATMLKNIRMGAKLLEMDDLVKECDDEIQARVNALEIALIKRYHRRNSLHGIR